MDAHKANVGAAVGTLLATASTLVCCVLPAIFVALGAGATLAGLVSAIPQLVWLSERKLGVFGTAGLLLVASGVMIWRARRLPCPIDPVAARSCVRLRKVSAIVYVVAAVCFAVGALFAVVLPLSRA